MPPVSRQVVIEAMRENGETWVTQDPTRIGQLLTKDVVYVERTFNRKATFRGCAAIEKYCKTHIAYGSLKNVQDNSSKPRDDMESFFLAETLKYLYLLNDPESEIDILNKHVFNTEAHPVRMFPVIEEELKHESRQQSS